MPFVACGDLSGFDSDLCYVLQSDYVSKPPVQAPIDPVYSDVCRQNRGANKKQLTENVDQESDDRLHTNTLIGCLKDMTLS